MLEKLKQKYDKKLETDFLSEALEIVEKPASPLGHFVIWITIAIVVAAVVWSFCGKMDEVAIASARIVPKDGVQVVQPLYEGVVTDILVEEGEFVRKGQELIILDSTAEKIGMENSEAKIKELKLQNDLISLLLKKSDILDYAKKNNIYGENEIQVIRLMISMQNENKLAVSQYGSQRSQYEKQLEIEKNTLEKLNGDLSALQKQKNEASELYSGSTPENQALENYMLQLENAEKEVKEYKKLYEIGAAAKYQLEEKQTALDEIKKQYELQQVKAEHESAGNSAEISELQREIDLLKKDISAQEKSVEKQEELLSQSETAIEFANAEFEQTLTNMLVSNNQTLTDFEADLKLREQTNKSQVLTAPVDGTVQTIVVTTVGGVVTSAQPVVSIVPQNAELIVEADVLNQDIGYVFEGQEVSVKLDTFSFQKYGTIDGKIIYVSPSAVEDERKGLVYKIKVSVDRNSFNINGSDVPISSGMSGTAEIKLEERKIIEFFLEPIFEYFDDSLKVR